MVGPGRFRRSCRDPYSQPLDGKPIDQLEQSHTDRLPHAHSLGYPYPYTRAKLRIANAPSIVDVGICHVDPDADADTSS